MKFNIFLVDEKLNIYKIICFVAIVGCCNMHQRCGTTCNVVTELTHIILVLVIGGCPSPRVNYKMYVLILIYQLILLYQLPICSPVSGQSPSVIGHRKSVLLWTE